MRYCLISLILIGIFSSSRFMQTAQGMEGKGTDATSSVFEKLPLVDVFKSRYEQLTRDVKEGKLPEEIKSEAEDLWVSVQKYMIHTDARIETLKLEAREYEGAKQEEALDQLVEVGAERERTLTRYINDLGNLTEREISPKTVPQKYGDIPDPEKAARDFEEGKKEEPAEYADPEKAALETGKKKKKGLDLEIIIEPEDIIKENQIAE